MDKRVDDVFRLYRTHGSSNYLGEKVSKTTHSLQCGMLAEKEGYSKQVILGAFLHDVGHLVGMDQKLSPMITDGLHLGTADHDKVGADFLRKLGFPEDVCKIVEGHVAAKRYLVYRYPEYYDNLSSASKQTLEHQGGRMSKEEAEAFEASPLCDTILCMRRWDERAKDPNVIADPLDKFEKICHEVLAGGN